jgi:hypothetical protein
MQRSNLLQETESWTLTMVTVTTLVFSSSVHVTFSLSKREKNGTTLVFNISSQIPQYDWFHFAVFYNVFKHKFRWRNQITCFFILKGFSIHILFIFFFYSFIIHMCIQGLGHFSPLPPPPPLPPTLPPPSPHHPSIPSRNYFALISNFVVERV